MACENALRKVSASARDSGVAPVVSKTAYVRGWAGQVNTAVSGGSVGEYADQRSELDRPDRSLVADLSTSGSRGTGPAGDVRTADPERRAGDVGSSGSPGVTGTKPVRRLEPDQGRVALPRTNTLRQGRGDPGGAIAEVLISQGNFNWTEISHVSGQSIEDCQHYARWAGVAFQDPERGDWQLAGRYLSGDVRLKLKQAQAMAGLDGTYQANVRALKRVLPETLGPGEIRAQLGAGWIGERDVQAFAREKLKLDVKLDYLARSGKWLVSPTTNFKKVRFRSKANTQIWGTRQIEGIALLEKTLNGHEVTLKRPGGKEDIDATFAARDKQRLMQEAFAGWVWSDPARAKRLANVYNTQFNAIVSPTYEASGLPDRLPGMVEMLDGQPFALRAHQKSAVLRLLQSGKNTYLVHRVGAGKTLVLGASAMQLKRLGLSGGGNICQVVPNHRPWSHTAEIKQVYPAARILTVVSDDLKKDRYPATMAKIAAGDYDFAVLTHSAFERIPPGAEAEVMTLQRMVAGYDQDLARLPGNAHRKRQELTRQSERYAKQLVRALEKAAAEPNQLTWNDLNVTILQTDESHRWKNLPFSTRHTSVAGLNPQGAARALDLYMKIQYLQRKCDRCGRFVTRSDACQNCGAVFQIKTGNLCFASATPIDNSIAELYNLQRYLQPDQLERLGLESFDGWVAHFSQPKKSIELAPFGGFKETTRLKDFKNIPELTAIFSEVADVQLDATKLDIPLPKVAGGEPENVTLPLSRHQKDYMDLCLHRAGQILAGEAAEGDNYLVILTDLYKASIDMRLIDPDLYPDDPNSKINTMVPRVVETYQRTTGVPLSGAAGKCNLTQVIWLDVGVPGGSQFNLYQDIRTKLVKAGVPASEVVFIHEAKDALQKAALFDKLGRGEVRILIASTPLAGEGANFQRLLSHAYELEPGWKATPSKQRRGRIERQGNLNPEIHLVRYITEGGDAYRWQTIERKALMSDQVLIPGANQDRVVEDIGDYHPDYSLVKAQASGNPLAKAQVALQLEIVRLRSLKNTHLQAQAEAQHTIDTAQAEIQLLTQTPAALADNGARSQELKNQIVAAGPVLTHPFPYEDELMQTLQALSEVEKKMAKGEVDDLGTARTGLKGTPWGVFRKILPKG